MNHNSNFHWPRRAGALLLVAGTLLAGELAGSTALLATPMQLAQGQTELPIAPTPRSDRALQSVRQAVRRDLAQHLNIPRGQVQIVSIDRQTWPDGCLGLAEPGQGCTLAVVEGWRVTARANNRTWIYRTNRTGTAVRREGNVPSTPNAQLPAAVRTAVLRFASEQFNVPTNRLRVIQADRRTWDGCLGISEPDIMCTMIALPGWRVVIADGNQRWVYHTNQDGTQVRLNPAESSIGGTISPIQMLPENVPQPLRRGVVFRSIANGGMLPRQTTTTLYEDGRVVVEQIDSGRRSERSYRVSRQQVNQFRQTLQSFDRFDRLDFSAPYGAADYITVMLISQNGVTQYADSLEGRLSPALQQVIEAWRDVVQAQPGQP
ncbi:hypothetical protein H6F67_23175 [Microcoleus sp. FACHB-1515]|uniref:hypothetical protein n=1 Tax=Cyanophyceae TaxID=3028117 RepID=UPI001688EDAB|nr:hypothetical protein [Microcoleus sp. FACHB-1515]MBD2092758.1 hypothetical protein [Microcoleus sp. FACHB-1515]